MRFPFPRRGSAAATPLPAPAPVAAAPSPDPTGLDALQRFLAAKGHPVTAQAPAEAEGPTQDRA